MIPEGLVQFRGSDQLSFAIAIYDCGSTAMGRCSVKGWVRAARTLAVETLSSTIECDQIRSA